MSSSIEIQLPRKSDPRWVELVTNGPSKPIKLLALKFMLTRMVQDIKRDPSPGTTGRNVDEIYQFFTGNTRLVATDAASLFG